MKEEPIDTSDLQQAIEEFAKEMENENKFSKSQMKIINAAMELFSKKGYENSTTSNIAKEAGVAEITIFRNFKSKNNLLYHLLAPLIIKISSPAILKDVKTQFNKKDKDTGKILEDLTKDRLDLLEKNEKVLRILLRESLSHEEILQSIIKYITLPAKQEATEFVNQRINEGEFKNVDSEAIVDLLFYTMFGYVISHQVLKHEGFTKDKDMMIKTMIELLLNGIKK
ncbi:TetR/AcrR family transcriptional regulator [Halalkalibacter urbisdiaboli]|uniref:TetR/AcrR family transcriptional regulator n=1 Tax=Halalkalibacter urbisdiaboli TaxID=1960589 RepID=UPI000B443730|nr:TetR/AcrR family transcriptional regulator [Halalkalibacter urbisdiaboli]